MGGRPKKPTKLKILAGKPGHRPLPKGEPMPTGRAVRPAWLNPAAAKVWDEIAPEAMALGTLTSYDAWEFGMLCMEMAAYERGSAAMPNTSKGLLLKLLADFGKNPTARTRISVKTPDKGTDEERFFGGKTA